MLVHQNQTSEGSVGNAINIKDRTVTNFRASGTCHAGIKLGLNGVLSTIQAAGGFSAKSGEWLVNGSASTFYVQRTITVGTLQVDPGSGFLQLNVDRIYDSQRSVNGFKTTTVFFEIADSVAGTNILATATMTFECEQGTL